MNRRNVSASAALVIFLLAIAAVFSVRLNAQDRSITKSTNDNNTTRTEEEKKFEPKAEDLSIALMEQVGFSMEKAANIRDILIDYNKDIAEARKEHKEEMNEKDSDVGSGIAPRMDGIIGHGVENYYRNSSPDLMTAYIRADKNADEKIVGALSDEHAEKYQQVKNEWWKKVKDEVFSPYSGNAKGKKNRQ